MLRDLWGRPLTTIRINVTSRCNFSCIFCHREGESRPWNKEELRIEDFAVVAKAAYNLGIRKIKLTGGEPLIRKDIVDVVKVIKRYGNPKDLSMTTNGSFLEDYAESLKSAGLQRVNVSLHSLYPERYKYITRKDLLDKIVRGILKAKDVGLTVKINTVVIKGFSRQELEKLVEFANKYKIDIQLIELQPVGLGKKLFDKYFQPLDTIKEILFEMSSKRTIRVEQHFRDIFIVKNIRVELVKAYNNHLFCLGCNRVRITSNGLILPCIMRDTGMPLLDILHSDKPFNKKVEEVQSRFILANILRRPFYR